MKAPVKPWAGPEQSVKSKLRNTGGFKSDVILKKATTFN
jgi:hypothetical protein